jgi:hypothetical protein
MFEKVFLIDKVFVVLDCDDTLGSFLHHENHARRRGLAIYLID